MLDISGIDSMVTPAFIPGVPGWVEIVIILMAVLLLFGGKKLPELARGLGRGLRLFRQEVKGIRQDIEEGGDVEENKDRQAPSSEKVPPQDKDDKDDQEERETP